MFCLQSTSAFIEIVEQRSAAISNVGHSSDVHICHQVTVHRQKLCTYSTVTLCKLLVYECSVHLLHFMCIDLGAMWPLTLRPSQPTQSVNLRVVVTIHTHH